VTFVFRKSVALMAAALGGQRRQRFVFSTSHVSMVSRASSVQFLPMGGWTGPQFGASEQAPLRFFEMINASAGTKVSENAKNADASNKSMARRDGSVRRFAVCARGSEYGPPCTSKLDPRLINEGDLRKKLSKLALNVTGREVFQA
jgi:hypothetical protein